jgi:hypothetical protein
VQTLIQLLPSPQEMGTCTVKQPMDLTKGWKQHSCVPGGYHLLHDEPNIGEISIVTGPRNSGLMASNNPGQEPTYQVWFPEMDEPMGFLTLDEIKGIIKYIHQLKQQQCIADENN